MTQTSTRAAEIGERPGEPMRLVAERLTAQGVDVGLPQLEDERRLLITCPRARCTLTVEDHWLVSWEWRPAAGGRVEPKLLADMACALLTGQAGERPRRGDGYGLARVTLKGIVGRELVARGLMVKLELFPDSVFYDAAAAIVATVPGSILDAQVQVTDNGYLNWECDYEDEAGRIPWHPERAAQIAGRETLAADIAARVTAALSVAQSAPARRQRLRTAAQGLLAWPWFLRNTSGGRRLQ